MNGSLQLHELSVVVGAEHHNPTVLNPDFLRINGIVPPEWELGANPVCTDPLARVEYANGVVIHAQFDRIIFAQEMLGRQDGDAVVANVAMQYVATLPHVRYTAVGINPKGHVRAESLEQARAFAVDNFVADGPWKEWNGRRASVVTKFIYPIEGGTLNLTVESGSLTSRGQAIGPVVLLSANFHRDLPNIPQPDKVAHLASLIRGWRSDVQTWRAVVESNLLGSQVKS